MITITDIKRNLYKKYPVPCLEECGLARPCVMCRKCGKWIATDFLRTHWLQKAKKEMGMMHEGREQAKKNKAKWMKKRGKQLNG